MFNLREARREDASAIRRLIWRVRINPTGLDWRRFLLAVDSQDRLLGCGQLKPHRDASVELASIAVQPACRRQGIAQAIILELLARSGRPVFLDCASPLRPFYEQFGFRVIGPEEMPVSFRRQWRWFNRMIKFLPASVPSL